MKSAAILTLIVLSYGCASEPASMPPPPAPSLPVAAVLKTSETTFSEYPASIEGTVDLEIRPQVSGTLDQIYVSEGAFVKKGQRLFKINDRPFREALNNARAALKSAEAALVNAALEVEKLTPLVAAKVVSEFQLKSARAAHSAALANVEAAKAGVGTAAINLGYTTITAPVSGAVGRLPKKQGSLVNPADPVALTQLSDAHDVHVYFSLGEDDFILFNKRYPGNTLTEQSARIPEVSLVLADQTVYGAQGKIDMVDGQFDKQTGAISMRATFPNAQGLLRSGNTGKIRLGFTHRDAFVIPQSATVEMQDKVFVYALADSNKVRKLPIVVAGKSGNNYLIREGLKSGDQIVLSGIDRLQEGQVIKPENVSDKITKLNTKSSNN